MYSIRLRCACTHYSIAKLQPLTTMSHVCLQDAPCTPSFISEHHQHLYILVIQCLQDAPCASSFVSKNQHSDILVIRSTWSSRLHLSRVAYVPCGSRGIKHFIALSMTEEERHRIGLHTTTSILIRTSSCSKIMSDNHYRLPKIINFFDDYMLTVIFQSTPVFPKILSKVPEFESNMSKYTFLPCFLHRPCGNYFEEES